MEMSDKPWIAAPALDMYEMEEWIAIKDYKDNSG